MKTNTQKYIIGSVSSGTMREEDLIPVFLDCIEEFDREQSESLRKEYQTIHDLEDEDEYLEQASEFFNETLFDKLDSFAPPYFYFGSHPGDGAGYGFWLSEDALREFDGLRVNDLSDVPADYSGEVLYVNDHGNTSLYTSTDGKLTVVWELV